MLHTAYYYMPSSAYVCARRVRDGVGRVKTTRVTALFCLSAYAWRHLVFCVHACGVVLCSCMRHRLVFMCTWCRCAMCIHARGVVLCSCARGVIVPCVRGVVVPCATCMHVMESLPAWV